MTTKEKDITQKIREQLQIQKPNKLFLETQFQKWSRIVVKDSAAKLSPDESFNYRRYLLEDDVMAMEYAEQLGLIQVAQIPELIKDRLTGIDFNEFKEVFLRGFDLSAKMVLLEPTEKLFHKIAAMAHSTELF